MQKCLLSLIYKAHIVAHSPFYSHLWILPRQSIPFESAFHYKTICQTLNIHKEIFFSAPHNIHCLLRTIFQQYQPLQFSNLSSTNSLKNIEVIGVANWSNNIADASMKNGINNFFRYQSKLQWKEDLEKTYGPIGSNRWSSSGDSSSPFSAKQVSWEELRCYETNVA